jgi:hypothetical protein
MTGDKDMATLAGRTDLVASREPHVPMPVTRRGLTPNKGSGQRQLPRHHKSVI